MIPLTEQTVTNTGQIPGQMLADAGYTSTANCDAAARMIAEPTNPYRPTLLGGCS